MYEVTTYDERYGPSTTVWDTKEKAQKYARYVAPTPTDVHTTDYVNDTQR